MIELRAVGVTYPGSVVALRDVSVAFRRGEFTVLLGRSGAGKSTLLRCLNGLVRPTAGSLRAEGLRDVGVPVRPGARG
jgi:phosphonate transport system ATP-binding protein